MFPHAVLFNTGLVIKNMPELVAGWGGEEQNLIKKLGPDGKGFPLAIDLHRTLIGNQKEGEIKAESRFVSKESKVIVIRTQITGKNDRLLAELTSIHVPAT